MPDYKFRTLTLDNWLETDPTLRLFVRLSPTSGQPHPMTGDDWARPILQPALAETVPLEVRELFEVARGTLVYGYFFYPLYTIGYEQLFRVADAATLHKCRMMSAPPTLSSFRQRVDWLAARKLWTEQEKQVWLEFVTLRNYTSHPEYQPIQLPGMAISTLQQVVDYINALFNVTQEVD